MPMIRLGNKGDGGYVIAEKCLEADSLISLGLGTNWTFDIDWLSFNPHGEIQAYDGTIVPEEFPKDLKSMYDSFWTNNIKHYKENVSKDNIDSILDRAKGSVFLKMDIEGYEYNIIANIAACKRIVGMVIEFHTLDFEDVKVKFKTAIELLDNFKIVHVHANNYGGVNNDTLPHTLEISFIRKDLCDTDKKRYNFYLHNLDSPNALSNEDYMLYIDNNTGTDKNEYQDILSTEDCVIDALEEYKRQAQELWNDSCTSIRKK